MSDNESEDTLNVADLDPRTTPLYKTSPERIGLAIGCRGVDLWQTDFNGCKDVTWYSGEPPVTVSIGYVRADFYDALQAALDVQGQALIDAKAQTKKMCNLLESLTAIVHGECPSLLDDLRDGNGSLDIAIDTAIAASKGDV